MRIQALSVLSLLAGTSLPSAAEPPPVRSGLLLWLDAGAIQSAAGPLAAWPDSSGLGHGAVQPQAAAQPSFDPARHVVRFDGANDFFSASWPAIDAEAITIFIVAAPRANPGFFRSPLSLTEPGKNDYTHGINVDLGSQAREELECINVEGQGAGGEQDLLDAQLEHGTFHVFTITSRPGKQGITVRVDGRACGARDRGPGRMRLAEAWIGARSYSNTPAPPAPSGFFPGEIAEVIVHARALEEGELKAVEGYLTRKHEAHLREEAPPRPNTGPLLQMLGPDFEVRELPVKLTNVNDLAYMHENNADAADRLIALGYDGRIHSLRDEDGNGIEETVEPYWNGAPFHMPTAMALRPGGLLVASQGKISWLTDSDQDGRLDRETIAASGWEPPQVFTGGGVDTLGLAVDSQGFIYFGLGCADFTNAYLLKDGVPHFRLESDRGTIQKLSPDFSRREAICRGIRFPVGLAFNPAGDLFATDQEGETWCPNGNPLDELDQIVPGRYYGFPPRHDRYLPQVVDEPPVASFGPQHQSTCGLLFNVPSTGGRAFGPPGWQGDAFVAGYSRGKLWRVELSKTRHGHVSRSTLVGSARMLLLDMALSKDGGLAVACHGGSPDWGTGPSGSGKLFKIFYVDRGAPQALFAWPAGPIESRVALDRPAPRSFEDAKPPAIVHGEHVRAGDRFELHRPGYAAVAAQLAAPVGELKAAGLRLAPDRRTLILATAPHLLQATYAVELSSHDLAYTLNGVETRWTREGAQRPEWSGWLPHLELSVARAFTRGSSEHDSLWALLAARGTLELRTRLVLPTGSSIAFTTGEGKPAEAILDGNAIWTVRLRTGEGAPATLEVSFHTDQDPIERPVPLDRLVLPWAPGTKPAPPPPPELPKELRGGDWRRGEAVFFGAESRCGTCHTLRGKGGKVGPDLSNLVHRDAASVLRDILQPSAAINPDHPAYTLVLADGRVLTGLVETGARETIRVLDANAQATLVRRDEVQTMEPSPVSLMPEGLDRTLGPARMKDLLAYLLAEAPDEAQKTPGTMHIVLVAGPKDHGPGEHDYPAWQEKWLKLLAGFPAVHVEGAWQWPGPAQWRRADLAVFYYWNHEWSASQLDELDQHLARGRGAVFLHSAVIPEREPEKLAARIGLAWEPGKTKFRHGPLDLKVTASSDEPIAGKLRGWSINDESYWPLLGDRARVSVLLTSEEDGAPQPMAWTFTPASRGATRSGRVFATLLGHYSTTFEDATARGLILRGFQWAGRFPADWDTLLDRAIREGEAFRAKLLEPRQGAPLRIAVLAGAVARFLEASRKELAGHQSLDAFSMAPSGIEAATRGARRLDARESLGGFEGRGFGESWAETHTFDTPAAVSGASVMASAWQYEWRGEEYEIRAIVAPESSQDRDVVVAGSVRLDRGELELQGARTPAVGIPAGAGRIIWLRDNQVLFTEIRPSAAGEDERIVTGFSYSWTGDGIDPGAAFQSIDYRGSTRRPSRIFWNRAW